MNELKYFKSNRKTVVELVKTCKNGKIYMGRCNVTLNSHVYKSNLKYSNKIRCWTCKKESVANLYKLIINTNTIEYYNCPNCENKLCHICLRETSHCQLIHTRKLLCYKFLLSKKIPKDVIRLITKKVK